MANDRKPRVLLFDIETSPLLMFAWNPWDPPGLHMLHKDWSVLSWAAKWLDEETVHYRDRRNSKDDKRLVRHLWAMMNRADIIITFNGKKFDQKKLNARFLEHGFMPPAPNKHIDVLQLVKRRFGFTSNSLAYLTERLCPAHRKLKHAEFAGMELWKECLAGNEKAWEAMEAYNKQDVRALEALYNRVARWGGCSITVTAPNQCLCGSSSFQRRGYAYTEAGQYRRYRCNGCGAWSRDRKSITTKQRVDIK